MEEGDGRGLGKHILSFMLMLVILRAKFTQNILLATNLLSQNALNELSIFTVVCMFICDGNFLRFCFQTVERILH